MGKTYEEILQKISEFCNIQPDKGFEISYLERAAEMLDLYTTAGGILDEYDEYTPEEAEQNLHNILEKVKNLI